MTHDTLSLTDRLLAAARVWIEAHDVTLARLGRTVVNDTSFFARLDKPNASPTTATLEKFARFLADPVNWPEGKVADEAKGLAHVVGVSAPAASLSAGQSVDASSRSCSPSDAGRDASASLGSAAGAATRRHACEPADASSKEQAA